MFREWIAGVLFTAVIVALVFALVAGIEAENKARAACPGYYNVNYGCSAKVVR